MYQLGYTYFFSVFSSRKKYSYICPSYVFLKMLNRMSLYFILLCIICYVIFCLVKLRVLVKLLSFSVLRSRS